MDGAFSYVFLFVTIFFFHASDGIELQLTPNTEQVKTSGSNIVLDCKLIDEGNVEAVVRWYNPNGEEIKNGNRTKIRKGSNFSKVYLINISAQDAGTYTCNTTFDGKPLEKSINLKIYKKHAFLNCSTYQQPIIHTNAKIGCIASGDPVPEVSWNYKGKIIKTGGRYHVKPDGLVIQNITEADNGNYVIESEITVRSEFIDRNIEVKVTIPPTITKPPVMSDPIKGSDFTMTCEAEGKPKPIYSWMKGGKKLDDERVSIDDIGGILKISSVKESDSGHYVCVAENVGGKVTAKAKVTVLIPPTLKPLENKQIDEGNQVTLQCVGDGVPAPSLTWQKGTDAPYAHGAQASDSRIIVTSENPAEKRSKLSLTIRNLKAEDAANYTCTATNSAGTQLKKSQLRVNYKPQIVNTPVVAYNWLNNKRNITCNAKGLPKPIISWQTKKGKINANDNTYEIFKEEGYELTIGNLQVSVSPSNYDTVFTDYQCVAINNVGQKQLDIKLKKAVVPRAPQKVNHMAVTPTTVTLVISPPVDNGGIAIDQYRIEYGTGGFHNQTDTFVNGQDKNEFTKVVLRQLSPETKYQIKVFAGNAVGLSTTFYDLSVTTLGVRKPYDVLINSNKFSPNPTSYTVTWHEPRSGGAKITSYSVQYRVVHIKKDVEPWEVDPDAQNGKFSAHTVKDTTSYVLHNLQPNTYYEVQVVAINAMGDSAPRPKIILTKESDQSFVQTRTLYSWSLEMTSIALPTNVGTTTKAERRMTTTVDKIDNVKSSSVPCINQTTGLLMALNAFFLCFLVTLV